MSAGRGTTGFRGLGGLFRGEPEQVASADICIINLEAGHGRAKLRSYRVLFITFP